MNEELSQRFTEVEVVCAMSEMNPSKASGPDGMNSAFFQKYWHVVGPLVQGAVLQALNSGVFPSPLNHTYITLIPKKKMSYRCCRL